MKYNVLLTGSHKASVEDLFTHMEENFTCITSSTRCQDLIRHIRIFQPDLLIMCLKSETEEVLRPMPEVKEVCVEYRVPFIVLGNKRECEFFKQKACYVADLMLIKPITNTRILIEIENHLAERKRIESEVLEEDRKLRAQLGDETPAPTNVFVKEELLSPPEPETPAETETVRKHVLVVDDDANMLKLIKHYLEDSYDVATALNGKLAVRFLSKKNTDLILLDYEMPEGSGDEVLATIRNFDKTKDIPVLFLTGVADPQKIKRVLAFKPEGYLLKPIDQQKLLEAVKEQIG